MAQKRKAQEAFGKPQGQLSAVAAARLAKKSTSTPAQPPEPNSESNGDALATEAANIPYDGHHSGTSTPYALSDDVTAAITTPKRFAATQLSLVKAGNANVVPDNAQALEISLPADEYITLVGEYDVEVVTGVATLYGTVLQPKMGKQRVYAPSTHALPQIQARQDSTQIRVTSSTSGLPKLENLFPLFRNIWSSSSPEERSFKFLGNTDDDPLQRSLYPIEIDKEIEKVMRDINLNAAQQRSMPAVIAVGAKSSGKSTFNRVLCNHIHSWTENKRCFYLDLDPGQPEFGPPGQLSLVEITAPILGPPFTHPASTQSKTFRLVRSHTIAATTFKDDPDLYLACAKDLINRADKNCPLVVNSCGWVTGLGATVLADITNIARITDVVLLEPLDDMLFTSLQAQSEALIFHRIPRRVGRPSTRTPAENRAMQTMAYFHRQRSLVSDLPRWKGKSLNRTRPCIVSYGGSEPNVSAILSYGQSPRAEFLAEVLDGSLVAIVVLDANADLTDSMFALGNQHDSSVARTLEENLPYIEPNSEGVNLPLDPNKSHCVGLALVRGIDIENQTLHLVTPLLEGQLMQEVADKNVVLVRGAFDPPEWVYLEDLYKNQDDTMGVSNLPWVTEKGRVGIESAVWRLRHPPLTGSAQR